MWETHLHILVNIERLSVEFYLHLEAVQKHDLFEGDSGARKTNHRILRRHIFITQLYDLFEHFLVLLLKHQSSILHAGT